MFIYVVVNIKKNNTQSKKLKFSCQHVANIIYFHSGNSFGVFTIVHTAIPVSLSNKHHFQYGIDSFWSPI